MIGETGEEQEPGQSNFTQVRAIRGGQRNKTITGYGRK